MAEERKDSFAETVDTAASAAHTVKGAIKAGKAISGAAKGAAAGGPYGAVAGAVWAGRKHIGKIVAVIVILLLLPVLFVLMLPGLIFGGLINAFSPSDTEQPVLNSETAIVENANDITFTINSILGEALDDVMARIEADFASSGADQMEVKNPYSSGPVYNANLIVSQYCAARDEDFESISLDDLAAVLRENKENLYSYTSARESREVTSEDPETGEETTTTEIWMVYTIRYNGESYLADHVFALTDEQKELASDYASNLSMFLGDGLLQNLTEWTGNSIPSLGDVTFTDGVTPVVYFNQLDERYASQPYGTDNIGGYGCGPSAADVPGEPVSEAAEEPEPPKPKRATRRKKTAPAESMEPAEGVPAEAGPPEPMAPVEEDAPSDDSEAAAAETPAALAEPPAEAAPAPASTPRRTTAPRRSEPSILTIRSREDVETQEDREDIIWHEIHNAYRTRRILTGKLGGIEQLDNRKTVAVVDYKGFRIIIPLKEMMINLGRSPSGQEYTDLMLRQNKILGNMLGADIDFVVRGIDSKTRSVVASRREAMMRKRQTFYFDLDPDGMYRVYEGRIVQARVIAVAEKVVRVEVFGVECSILARDLAWDWIGDAHERFAVGDEVLVRILSVRRNSLEDLGIRADIKSTSENTDRDNLQKCRIQGKYAGKVTDVHKGVVYVRLANGVNAVAHSCYDYRMPGKKDDVSFAVTRLDMERGVAVGIITRIIRQNL